MSYIYSVHTIDGTTRHHNRRMAVKAARRAAKSGMSAKVWKFLCYNGEPVRNLGCIVAVAPYWSAKNPAPRIVRQYASA